MERNRLWKATFQNRGVIPRRGGAVLQIGPFPLNPTHAPTGGYIEATLA